MSKSEISAESPDAEVRSGRKKFLVLGLILGVAAAGAAWFFVSGKSAVGEEPPAHGEVVSLDPVAINLAGGGYLKVGVALHLTEDASAAEGGQPDSAVARDLIIGQFSQASPVDVHGAREALKESLEQKIIEAYGEAVLEIYYTEYVTQ